MDTRIFEAEAFGLLQNRRAAFVEAATPFVVGAKADTSQGGFLAR